jgi:hypothetical protein
MDRVRIPDRAYVGQLFHPVPQVHFASLLWSLAVLISLSSAKIKDVKPQFIHPSIPGLSDKTQYSLLIARDIHFVCKWVSFQLVEKVPGFLHIDSLHVERNWILSQSQERLFGS